MALQGTKALEAWCRRVTAGYPGVNILNMTTSWRSGLAFCAIIHHHCPELLDFHSLDPDDVFGNNELAFQIAEQHLGVPSLLDPRDMVECELLDRLSILTYLAQYHQAFHGQAVQNRIRRIGSMSKSSSINSDLAENGRGGRQQVPTIGRGFDPCRVCAKSVFILERLNVGGRILHRTCFKCARCENQLSLAGYYETESGEYCCELCPDEEQQSRSTTIRANASVVEIKAPAGESAEEEEVDSGHSSEDTSDGEEEEPEMRDAEGRRLTVVAVVEEEDSKADDPETNDESVTSGYVEDSVHVRLAAEAVAGPEEEDEEVQPVNEAAGVDCHPPPTPSSTSAVNITAEERTTTSDTTTTNPFGDDDDDEGDVKAAAGLSNVMSPVAINFQPSSSGASDSKVQNKSLNPFGSDDEDNVDDNAAYQSRSTALLATTASLSPSEQGTTRQHNTAGNQVKSHQQSSSSLNPFGCDLSSEDDDDVRSRGSVSPSPSTRSATRLRKKRRAPLPPPQRSTPGTPRSSTVPTAAGGLAHLTDSSSRPVAAPRLSLAALPPSGGSHSPGRHSTPPPPLSSSSAASAEAAKRLKDENNMNRRSQILESIRGGGEQRPEPPSGHHSHHHMVTSNTSLSSQHTLADSAVSSSCSRSETVSLMSTSTTTTTQSAADSAGRTSSSSSSSPCFSPLTADKADDEAGQWRKKKGPAPPRPIPPRRTVKKLHRRAINQELEDIEVKQSELERQGVRLEQTIREICDKSDAEAGADRDSLGPEAEDLIIQLFDLVNEKNELFRRQTELVYMKKENRLEEAHADLEYQIRVLMARPESQRTPEDRLREEQLIGRLVQVVGLRNEIVDCLEMDRLRELDEDTAIEDHMSNYAAVKPAVEAHKKMFPKILKLKKKKKKNRDSEKDVDTSETSSVVGCGGVTDSATATGARGGGGGEKKNKSTKKKLLSYASKKLAFSNS